MLRWRGVDRRRPPRPPGFRAGGVYGSKSYVEVPLTPPTLTAMVSESTLPVKPGDQPPPALSQIPPAIGCPPLCPVIGRMEAFGYVAISWANEARGGLGTSLRYVDSADDWVPVCHQPDGAVSGFHVCHV